MRQCIICEIIKHQKYLEDTIIYENDLFVLKAAKGMVVSGHLLIIPKKHINGLAELSLNELKKIEEFVNKISKKIKQLTKTDIVLFEHGSLPEGRHPQSIVHAHLHIIPYNFTIENYKRIINDCQLRKIEKYNNIKDVAHKDYCYFRDKSGIMYLSSSIDFPRSIIFKIMAEQEGLGYDYEWRDEKNNDVGKLTKTIELGKKIIE